jgi:hypothetical protein
MSESALAGALAQLMAALYGQAPSAALDTYVVRFVNQTTTTFDEVWIFYKRKGQNGVVSLNKNGLLPGEVTDFELGPCQYMESYVIGVFIGEDLVAQLPAPGDGNMTPERASQLNPLDVDPCSDIWEIFEEN